MSWHAHALSTSSSEFSKPTDVINEAMVFVGLYRVHGPRLKKRIDRRFDQLVGHALAPETVDLDVVPRDRWLFPAVSSSIALAQVSITFCCTYSNSDFAGCHWPFVASTSNAWGGFPPGFPSPWP